MKKGNSIFIVITMLLLSVVLGKTLWAKNDCARKPSKEEVSQKTMKLRMPFITNEGQADERVKFYANTLSGRVFVAKDGEIVYSLPKFEEKAKDCNHEGREGHEENLEDKTFLKKKFSYNNAVDSLKWVSFNHETWGTDKLLLSVKKQQKQTRYLILSLRGTL